MWGAIVQAIDHAMGRMNEGMGSGIKVAESQSGGSGGAAMAKPASSGANLASAVKNIANIKDEKASEDKATEEAKKAAEEAKKAAEDAKEAEKAEETGKAEDATIISDCRLKELFGTDDIVKLFSHINSYEFKYTPKALRLYNGTKGVDEGTNIGVMAQELEKNPVTENTVIDDENGYKNIETNKLAAADTAVLADVCKRLIAIEERLGMSKE